MKSINKALTILEVFMEKKGGLGLSEMSRSTGINISTLCIIASTLTKRGYLRQDGKRGKYHLGNMILALGDGIRTEYDLRNIALSYLDSLAGSVGETIVLGALEGHSVIILERIQSSQLLSVTARSQTTLHSSCLGKVILSGMSPEELDRSLANINLTPDTPNTITDVNKLKKQVTKIRRDGYAVDDQEKSIGVKGVAAPVFDKTGKIASAVAIIAPSIRAGEDRMPELIKAVKGCARDISTALGYKGMNTVAKDRARA